MNSDWTIFLPGFIRKKLAGRQLLQDVLGNTGWMMGDQVVRQVVGLLIGVWLARYLGPHLFGEFSYALAILMIVSPIATLSLDSISIRQLIQDPAACNKILGTSFILMIGGGMVAYGLAMAIILSVRPDDRLVQWLVGIMAAGTIVQVCIAIEFWFESQMQWKYTVYAKTSAFLLLSLVKISLILMKAPVTAFAWAGLADTALGSAGLLLVYWKKGLTVKTWQYSKNMAKKLLHDSLPLLLSTLLAMIYLRIDQIMLGNMTGSEELGNYSVAVRISEAWYFIPMVISSSVFPAIVETEAASEELFYTHMQKLYNLMAFLAYAVALPVAFFSQEIIRLLFTSAYNNAGQLLAVLIWTGLFTSLGAARGIFIVSKNWTRVHLLTMALGCAANIILNLFLIPRYGAMGAVAATFISYWFAVHGSCFLFKSLRRTGWMISKAMLYPKVW